MSDLIYAGKRIEELTIEELRLCALHFRDAHVETIFRLASMERRMKKMELALTKEQLAKLDWWLEHHPQDLFKGDGSPMHFDWTMFELTPTGYRTKGDKF